MDPSSQTKLSCLVADSGAFIKNVPLSIYAERVITVSDVVSEIRDAQTRQRLAVLPYEIQFREPTAELVKFVTEFSKKTGDFKSLSAVDIRVLALACQLEKEFCDASHIKDEPTRKTVVVPKSRLLPDHEIVGFFKPRKGTTNVKDGQIHEGDIPNEDPVCEDLTNLTCNDAERFCVSSLKPDSLEDIHQYVSSDDAQKLNENENGCLDDEDGWITPSNVQDMKRKMGVRDTEIDSVDVRCGCITTDFAMQNVLIQMGLHVISVEGRLIKEARSYIQKCYGCNKETHDMERIFCPSCGNKTLLRVAVTVEADGTIQYHYPNRRRNFNIRGTKFSIPSPKGGRHAEEVILCEDYRSQQKALPKLRDDVNPLDPDYVARDSPFVVKDTNSRAFNRGLHLKGTRKKNPNEARKRSSRKS